jgi:hypothetical protein
LGRRGIGGVLVAAVVAVIAVVAVVLVLILHVGSTPTSGNYRVTGAGWTVVYANGPGSYGPEWLGSTFISSCVNCPVLLAAGAMVSILVNFTNHDALSPHNISSIWTPMANTLVISGVNATFPILIGAGSSLAVSVSIVEQGSIPTGTTNETLSGFVDAD